MQNAQLASRGALSVVNFVAVARVIGFCSQELRDFRCTPLVRIWICVHILTALCVAVCVTYDGSMVRFHVNGERECCHDCLPVLKNFQHQKIVGLTMSLCACDSVVCAMRWAVCTLLWFVVYSLWWCVCALCAAFSLL